MKSRGLRKIPTCSYGAIWSVGFCSAPALRQSNTFTPIKSRNLSNQRGTTYKLYSRVLKFCRISIKFSWKIIRNAGAIDTVFSVTNPAFFIPICAFFKVILGYRLILLAYDIFPENLVAAGLIKQKSFLYKTLKAVFDWSYRKADIVISIGRDMTEVLKSKGISEDKIELIQNWADPDAIKRIPKKDNPIIKEYKLENEIVFLFAGNFGRVQGIPELLEVIDHVSADNAAFLFIGDGAMRGVIEQYQKDHPGDLLAAFPEFFPSDVIAEFKADSQKTEAFRRIFETRGRLGEQENATLLLSRYEVHGQIASGVLKHIRAHTHSKMRLIYHLPEHGAWGRVLWAYVCWFWTRTWRVRSWMQRDPVLREYAHMVETTESGIVR